MISRLVWRADAVISLQLVHDLYCLAQMRPSPYLTFYGVRSADGGWAGTDLREAQTLFTVMVAERRLKPIMDRVVPRAEVTPDDRPLERLMIKPRLNLGGGHPFAGGDLIEIDDRGETVGMPVVRAGLQVGVDDELIRAHELTNMWVGPEQVHERLTRWFRDGVDWDPDKELVFPGITPSA